MDRGAGEAADRSSMDGKLDAISGSLVAIRRALVRALQAKGGRSTQDEHSGSVAKIGGAEGWLRWVEANARRRQREEAREEREEDDEKLIISAILRDQVLPRFRIAEVEG